MNSSLNSKEILPQLSIHYGVQVMSDLVSYQKDGNFQRYGYASNVLISGQAPPGVQFANIWVFKEIKTKLESKDN